jgi:hypothetical protein
MGDQQIIDWIVRVPLFTYRYVIDVTLLHRKDCTVFRPFVLHYALFVEKQQVVSGDKIILRFQPF